VSVEEINQLEIQFLHRLNFNINIEFDEYEVYWAALDQFFNTTDSEQIQQIIVEAMILE
jgi:hypothetical protein